MILLPRALEQRLVGRVLEQGVLERIGGVRRHPALVQYFGLHELRQAPFEPQLVQGGHGPQQLVGKRPSQHRPQLRHPFGGGQTIQARQEGVLQRGGNREKGQRAGQRIAVLVLLQQPRLQDRLGQLFHKQRHAIRHAHDLLEHYGG